MKYSKTIPADTFKKLMLNAAILLSDFDPETATVTEDAKLGATSGGVTFTATTTYTDFGSDIDNCPKNSKELKRIDSREVKVSGTFIVISPALAAMLDGAADVDSTGNKIVPRAELESADFKTLWLVGDYSDKNGEKNGGMVAIKLNNALSTGGLSIATSENEKGKFAFEFTAHSSIEAPDAELYEIYVKAGTDEA